MLGSFQKNLFLPSNINCGQTLDAIWKHKKVHSISLLWNLWWTGNQQRPPHSSRHIATRWCNNAKIKRERLLFPFQFKISNVIKRNLERNLKIQQNPATIAFIRGKVNLQIAGVRDEGKTKSEKLLTVKFGCRSLALNENTKACYNQSTSYNIMTLLWGTQRNLNHLESGRQHFRIVDLWT